MKFMAHVFGKLKADQDLWVKTGKVLRLVLEGVSFLAAIKTLLQ